jgi:cytochrome c oxidase assembly protein subunit 11
MAPVKNPSRNTLVLFGLAAIVGIMLGIVSQAEPIYKMFCGATGLGGTTQNSVSAPTHIAASAKDRIITVTFDGNVDPALPWDFEPEVRSVQVHLGQSTLVKFRARNRGTQTTVGTAVHNVQPDKAGLYFDKTQCFCFTKQTLKPGQSEELPVTFYIDPEMAKDRTEDDVTAVTLSYTFYLAKDRKKAHTAGVMKGMDAKSAPPTDEAEHE